MRKKDHNKYLILCNVSVFLFCAIPWDHRAPHHCHSPALSESSLTWQRPVGHDCQEQDRLCLSLTTGASTIVQPSSPLVYPMPILGTTITVLHNHAHQHPCSSLSTTILLPPQRPWTLTLVHGLLLYIDTTSQIAVDTSVHCIFCHSAILAYLSLIPWSLEP